MKEMPALLRLVELDEIAAAFVFDRSGKIIGTAVPLNYTETMLKQVVLVLQNVLATVERTQMGMREARFFFESYGLWLKGFAGDYILAVFLQPGADPGLLRQPINLAVVNLEKAVSSIDQNMPVDDFAVEMAAAAHQAELQMLKVDGEDSNGVFERMTLLAEYFFGPVATELMEHGLRAKQKSLPLKTRADMEEMASYCVDLIDNGDRKKMYREIAGDMIERIELELPPPPEPPKESKKKTKKKK